MPGAGFRLTGKSFSLRQGPLPEDTQGVGCCGPSSASSLLLLPLASAFRNPKKVRNAAAQVPPGKVVGKESNFNGMFFLVEGLHICLFLR